VAKKLYSLLKEQDVKFELSFPLLEQNEQEKTVSTQNRKISYGYVYNCAGAHADRVAKLFGKGEDYTMVSFKRIL
jgi:L-2-hydroxyglutarate oxidase LhgO